MISYIRIFALKKISQSAYRNISFDIYNSFHYFFKLFFIGEYGGIYFKFFFIFCIFSLNIDKLIINFVFFNFFFLSNRITLTGCSVIG